MVHSRGHDYDAIVVGAGHNGLVCAAYLAKAGRRTLLLEARDSVGGTAASERFAGATVNICNCDHITFRTTPVIEELGLAAYGLRYLDVEPAQLNLSWEGGPAWPIFHELDRTLEALALTYPDEVEGYRRYAHDAIPAVRLVLAAAARPPSVPGLGRLVLRSGGRGTSTLLRWSRRSAAEVLRQYFHREALLGPALLTGPMVWGVSPETPGTGLGALSYALRHVGTVGRPIGGSGMVPLSLLQAFTAHGGTLRTGARVEEIRCDATGARAVRTTGGEEITASVVVSACDPHRTFVRWLKNPPSGAEGLVQRWRRRAHHEGYESKIDAVVTVLPRLRALRTDMFERLGGDPARATVALAPTVADMHAGAGLIPRGRVLERPGMLANAPSVLDPSMAPVGKHVFSLETLFTPYSLVGGWPGSGEPRRWLAAYAGLAEPGFLDALDADGVWRAMTPDVYERDFHLAAGHAASFAGGPLAMLRNTDPELTRYATAVPGLFLTGAATFPGAGIWGASGRNCALTILAASG
ncbi:MAG: phytoene desaturase family protein [Mycobacteriales bacterium]